MDRRSSVRVRVRQQLREFGSLASAIGIVLLVLAFSVVSIGAGGAIVAPIEADSGPDEIVADLVGQQRVAELYLDAEGIEGPPLVYRAKLTVSGWSDRSRRIIRAQVTRAEPLVPVDSSGASPSNAVAEEVSQRLRSGPVLASVAPAAVDRIPSSGPATVSLVVTPRGQTATLFIDDVIGEDGAPLTAAIAAGAGSAGVAASADVSSTAITPAATVGKMSASSLSRYYGKPGTRITISGFGFGKPSASKWVTAGGVKATWLSWSDTSITFVVPTKMRSPGYVGVVYGTKVSNGLYYIPFTPPVLTSVLPREGAPGSVVTLEGSHFGSRQGSSWVTFSGRSAQVVSWSDSKVKVVVPRGAEAGYVGVIVQGLVSNGILYSPHGLPFVTGVSVRSMHAGQQQVVIEGRDFGNAPGRIVFAGRVSTPSEWGTRRVTFTVPANAVSGYLGVQRPDGATSNGVWRHIVPRLDSLSRWWASPGDVVELRGQGFGPEQGSWNVYIAGKSVPALSWSDTLVTAEVPEDAASGYVGVGTPAACTRGKFLLVEQQASIDTVSPRSLRTGEQFVITGSGFGPALPTSRVEIGGINQCIALSWSDDEIVAIVPPGATNGYVGVNKRGVNSNGVWVQILP